jgi:hypothetical protein
MYTELARRILRTPDEELRKPLRVREDMSWSSVGKKFAELLESLA